MGKNDDLFVLSNRVFRKPIVHYRPSSIVIGISMMLIAVGTFLFHATFTEVGTVGDYTGMSMWLLFAAVYHCFTFFNLSSQLCLIVSGALFVVALALRIGTYHLFDWS